jgi:hypothetical protein
MIGGLHHFFAIPSHHTPSRLPCMDSLFLFIWGTSHMSQICSCNSMILRVRVQSIHDIGCHHLCVIHRGLLPTYPSVRCWQLVTSFANALGIFVLFQTSEFHLVCSNGSVAQALLHCRRPHLHYLVLIVLLRPLFHGFSPVYIIEHIPTYCFIENFIKLPFQWVLIHPNRSPNEGAIAVLFPLLQASRNFQNAQPSVIRPYLLVRTSDRLDSGFVGTVTSWWY